MSADDIPALARNWERLLARFGSLPCRRAAPAELTLATPADEWPAFVPWERVRDATVDYGWKRKGRKRKRPLDRA